MSVVLDNTVISSVESLGMSEEDGWRESESPDPDPNTSVCSGMRLELRNEEEGTIEEVVVDCVGKGCISPRQPYNATPSNEIALLKSWILREL